MKSASTNNIYIDEEEAIDFQLDFISQEKNHEESFEIKMNAIPVEQAELDTVLGEGSEFTVLKSKSIFSPFEEKTKPDSLAMTEFEADA